MSRMRSWGMGGCLLFLLAGCGPDRPYTGTPTGPAPASTFPLKIASDAPAPSSLPDPLLSGSNGSSPSSADPLLSHDPLLGRAMPTAHSHWLRGRLRDARVTVLLNGIRHGSFSGVLDQDITMKLRAGVNTVTFLYAPASANAAANLEIVESEHHPPIAPLVTFNSASNSAPNGTELKPQTKTFTFMAN